MPKYTVTWPTRPAGVYTIVTKACNPTEAARNAADQYLPTAPGYGIAFDYEPEVWEVRRPYRVRFRRVQGPRYGKTGSANAPFVPIPYQES